MLNTRNLFSAARSNPVRLFSTAIPLARHEIKAGVILKRNPVTLRTPTAFERSLALYHQQIQQSSDISYDSSFFETQRMSFLGNQEADEKDGVQTADSAVDQPSLMTKDQQNMKSLNRHLDRTLYLLVKKPQRDSWQFPQGKVEEGESLREAAAREIAEECGENMSIWFAGNAPVGHLVYDYPKAASSGATGAKVFFMKSQIFSGQAEPDGKEIVDFAWVTKEEMKDYVEPVYYETVKDCLADR